MSVATELENVGYDTETIARISTNVDLRKAFTLDEVIDALESVGVDKSVIDEVVEYLTED